MLVETRLDCTGPRMTSMSDTRNPSTLFSQNQKYGCDQIWSRSNMVNTNMVAFKYGRNQIWSQPNMVATNEREHRTLKEWLRTHSPRVENCRQHSYGF